MKPLLLHGHERAITKICFNREGDLLFSTAKDKEPSIWFTINGERLGTLRGHEGAVWSVDCDWQTQKAVTGASDFMTRVWNVETGKQLHQWVNPSTVRSVGFSYSGNLVLVATAGQMGHAATLKVHDLRDPSTFNEISSKETASIFDLPLVDAKYFVALWGTLDETIYVGTTDGALSSVDMRERNVTNTVEGQTGQITDIQANKEKTMLILSSKDTSARLYNARTLEPLKTYKTDRPVNSAAISPIRQHVLLGGGQEAMDVTRTAVESGKFEARFFHLVFEDEFARVAGHFGPLNTVAFHPDGKMYASGAEDGYVRLHTFEDDYLKFTMEGEN